MPDFLVFYGDRNTYTRRRPKPTTGGGWWVSAMRPYT